MAATYAGSVGDETLAAAVVERRRSAAGAAAAGLLATSCGVAVLVLHMVNGPQELTGWWTGTATIALTGGALGWVVARQAPGNPIGWLLCAAGVGNGVCGVGREYLVWSLTRHPLPGALAIGAASDPLFIISMTALPAVLMLFPDGRPLPGRWWRVALAAVPVLGALALLGALVTPGAVDVGGHRVENPLAVFPDGLASGLTAVGSLSFPVLAGVAIAALGLRYRRADAATRRRLVWITWAGVLTIGESAVELVPGYTWGPVLGPLACALLVGAIAVGIVRHRLLDIELVVNRTLVYVTASALLIAAYVGVVTLVSRLGASGLGGELLGTAVVAVAFAPLRYSLQRAVDRLLYGERDDPYGVMSSLGRELAGAEQPGSELAIVLDVVVRSLRLPYAAFRDAAGALLAETGRARGPAVARPLTHRGELIGRLLVCPRTPGSTFSAADERLLDDLARQSGALLHAVRLAGDLQESRRRLVAAKEEERRRLRRDLHDGLGPELAALTLKLDGAALQLTQRPERTAELLGQVRGGLTGTIEEIRRLVYDLRPPALDELGLLGALRDFVRRLDTADGSGPLVTVDSPAEWPALPAAVEVAAYRIATEAVTNVVRHAAARHCTVCLAVVGERLDLEIVDDGRGLPVPRRAGVGTRSITERAEEIGGSATIAPRTGGPGTVVRAELPLWSPEEARP